MDTTYIFYDEVIEIASQEFFYALTEDFNTFTNNLLLTNFSTWA